MRQKLGSRFKIGHKPKIDDREIINDTSVLAVARSQVCISDVVYQLEEDFQIAFIGRPLESIRLIGRAATLLPKPEPEYMRYRSAGRVSVDGLYKLDEVPEGVTVLDSIPSTLLSWHTRLDGRLKRS